MKILMARRRLTRLSFVMMCILCGYGFYQAYLFHFQQKELANSLYNPEKFELYGGFYPHDGVGDKHQQKAHDFSNKGQKDIDYDSQQHTSSPNFKDNDQVEMLGEKSVARVPSIKTQPAKIPTYVDSGLSDKFMDIHDLDNMDMNSVDRVISKIEAAKERDKNFHYPDVGFRYNEAMNKSQVIPVYKLPYVQNISTTIASNAIPSVSQMASNFSKASLLNYTVTNSSGVKSNVSKINMSNASLPNYTVTNSNAVKSNVSKIKISDTSLLNYNVTNGNAVKSNVSLIKISHASLPNYNVTNGNAVKSNVSLIKISNVGLSNYNITISKAVKSNAAIKKITKKPKPVFSNVMPPPVKSLVKNRTDDLRYLVYVCDSFSLCGGWGDRQRGIVSSYLLSRLVDRQFKIIMTTPCNLGFFYKPNLVQWQPKPKELHSSSNISINALLDKNFQYTIMKGDFNSIFPQKVVYLKTSQDYYDRMKKNTLYLSVLNEWGGLNSRYSRFHWAWSELMQPSPMILTHLQHIMGTQFLVRKGLMPNSSTPSTKRTNSTTGIDNSTLICAHVRIGKNPTNPMDENLHSFKLEYLSTLFEFMRSKDVHGDARFFVATDYDHVRSESKQFFGNRVVDYGGKILHIDRQRGEQSACVGFEVALMDQLILSLCDSLVVCKSGFSMNAAFMSNSMGHVHILKDGVINAFKG